VIKISLLQYFISRTKNSEGIAGTYGKKAKEILLAHLTKYETLA
jgi:hypothetical protein